MEIIHHLTFKSNDEPKLLQLLRDSGIMLATIDLPSKKGQSISILISESNVIWPLVQPLLIKSKVLDSYDTTFSKEEIFEAEWVRLVNIFEQGYPQPERTWVTRPINYDEFCKSCGIYKQTKTYRIAREPKLGKNSFMSLVWTGDSLFTTPEVLCVWKENQITGCEPWNVILHKENSPAKSILQVFIPQVTLPGLLANENLSHVICHNCGTKKYEYHRYGKMYYKKNSIPTGIDIIRTNEWFGAGHLAFQEILISNKLVKVILENKWQGLTMKVVETI